MKKIVYLSILIFIGCKNRTNTEINMHQNDNVKIANKFIDAFYSFNEDSLKLSLSYTEKSDPSILTILYYQKWAECGNYEVLNRYDCIEKNDTLVMCPVKVKDDLMKALQLDLNVTDTFHINIKNRKIQSIQTSSNDPDVYYEAKDWIKQNRIELIENPCDYDKEVGPTPCECIKGTIKGLTEFKAYKEFQENQ
jgi:hypothetical protein|tara:strand:+ start:197 stop:778 length:582 start_codon:yes stop_codon:yes gene_type:complete